MDCSRKTLVNFSTKSPLTGCEVPASKIIKPSQVHRDFLPFRTAATFIVSPSPQPSTTPVSPAYSPCKDPFRIRTQSDLDMPAQLLHSGSFAEVPVQTHFMRFGRSDAVRAAREKQNTATSFKLQARGEQRSRQLDFEPYTVADYRKLKPTLSQPLGGLGPFTVGTERWQVATEKLTRMKDFSATIRRTKTIT